MQTFAHQSVLAMNNARLFREVEQKGRQLAMANAHKDQFFANMSHELRTPLNGMLGFAELLDRRALRRASATRPRRCWSCIQNNGKHLLGLINDVLDISKIDAGQLTLSLDDYSLQAIVGYGRGVDRLAGPRQGAGDQDRWSRPTCRSAAATGGG